MRAISPGRPQSTRQALCTAQWDGLRLVAYLSGNTVIILDGPRNILQTITVDNARFLVAVTVEESSGRIAVCDDRRVQVYNAVGKDEDDLRWAHAQELEVEDKHTISCLSWGSSDELLVGGSQLWLYHLPYTANVRLIWQQQIANPVAIAAFSNDAELIATCGPYDRIIKIWRRLSYELDNTRFDVSYLPHPSAVTNIHWRKPWHREQALDNLLYSFCSDNQVRLWTYSDSHSLSVMQLIATVDANASIQPRRLSASTLSRRRFVFILDSRDFSQAAEKSLQHVQDKTVNHALEHLIEVANRSPEICVVFDGLGHMSAWGLENAGCRSTKPTVVFNVTLVDDVHIQLKFQNDHGTDFVQFCSFAGGATSTSLSLLVHSYTGQIDWYESPVAQFFDTSIQEQRLQLVSSWSGHDLAIDHIARGVDSNEILSWTDEGQATLWSQASSGALQRMCQVHAMESVLAVIVLGGQGYIISLHDRFLILWSVDSWKALTISKASLRSETQPQSLRLVMPPSESDPRCTFLVEFADSSLVLWSAKLPARSRAGSQTNGVHSLLQQVDSVQGVRAERPVKTVAIDGSASIPTQSQTSRFSLMTISETGLAQGFSLENTSTAEMALLLGAVDTEIFRPALARATATGLLALTDSSGKSLSIFNIAQQCREWTYDFSGPDHIQKMAWTSIKTGPSMLFVSFSYHAYIIGQTRYCTARDGDCWMIFQDISLRDFTTNYIGDVSWLPSCDLAVAAGNQIFVVESTCNRTNTKFDDHAIKKGEAVKDCVGRLNTVLPVYHPVYLQLLAQQGYYARVSEILIRLHEKLKYFVDGDELDSFLDQGPSYWSSPGDGQVMVQEHHVADIADSLQQYIASCELRELATDASSDLCQFISNFVHIEKRLKSLDENALRYLLTLYATPNGQAMPWSSFVFASRSVSQEALLDLVLQHHNNKLTWDVARCTGLFVWLEDPVTLQTQFENVARAEYIKHEDRNPVDCSLYYLALNKKSVLQGLWRMTIGVNEKENTMRLLANDFNDPRWKSTALKNAYALLSKRRFEYAAAFFLLGSSLKDAINVCINQLNDLQLAIAIARVWKQDEEHSRMVLKDLLSATVIPDVHTYDQGRWIAVWAFSLLEEPISALQAITRPLHQISGSALASEGSPALTYHANDPCLTMIYQQIRADLIRKGRWCKGILNDDEEYGYIHRVRAWLIRAGLDLCATQLISTWESKDWQTSVHTPTTAFNPPKMMGAHPNKTTAQIDTEGSRPPPAKPPPTQLVEPSMDSLLDNFGF